MTTTRKLTLAALFAAGFAFAGTTSVSAHGGASVYVGPGSAGITYNDGYYYDRGHHRHGYRYPSDWRNYGYPQAWYQTHSHWDDRDHRDWYRGGRDRYRDSHRHRDW